MTSPLEPAFPELHIHHFLTDAEGKEKPAVVPRWMGGLTKREYFAACAMRGVADWDAILNQHSPEHAGKVEAMAKSCLAFADALIAALDKP